MRTTASERAVPAEVRRTLRLRLLLIAVVVGLATFALSCLFYAPGLRTWSLGDEYARMSEDPFGRKSWFPHRLLGPLLAHLLGLGGARYWLFAHGTMVLFLASVFLVSVWKRCSMHGAVALTTTIAITGAVELYKTHVGYPEPMTYTLLLWSVCLTRRTTWFWVVQFASLMNHENVMFFWPWLLALKVQDVGGIRRADVVGAIVTALVYLLVRQVVMGDVTVLSFATYWSYWSMQHTIAFSAGMCILDVVAMVAGFGTLPALLVWQAWFDGFRRAGLGICLALGGIFAMSWFAADLLRFIGFLALPVCVAGMRLLHQPRGTLVMWILCVTTAAAIVAQRPVVRLIYITLGEHPPDLVAAVPTEVVPQLWYVFLGYALLLGGMLWAGRHYARRSPRAVSGAPGSSRGC